MFKSFRTVLAVAAIASGALAAGAQARPAIDSGFTHHARVGVAPARVDSIGVRPATAPRTIAAPPVEATPITVPAGQTHSGWAYAAIAVSALLGLVALVLLVHSLLPNSRRFTALKR